MTRAEAKAEFREELEMLIMSAVQAVDDVNGCYLSKNEYLEWANLLFAYNNSLSHMRMHMTSPHRTKEFH